MPGYIPEKGDFVVLSFDPQSGHEQTGRRPALVVSNTLFNRHTGLAIVCPMTNSFRNIPFHPAIPDESSLTGYIIGNDKLCISIGQVPFRQHGFMQDTNDINSVTCQVVIDNVRNHG